MKSPQGLMRVKNVLHRTQLVIPGDSFSIREVLNVDLPFTLELLEEMAKALDDLLRTPDQTKIDWQKHNRTLDKFLEWK